MSNFTVGQTIVNTTPFTSLIGAEFQAGRRFTVDLVGEVNTRARDEIGGCVVWIDNHYRHFAGTGLYGHGPSIAVAV